MTWEINSKLLSLTPTHVSSSSSCKTSGKISVFLATKRILLFDNKVYLYINCLYKVFQTQELKKKSILFQN